MPLAGVHVILNPKSGGGRAGRQRVAIESALQARGVAATVHETRASGHAAELAGELAKNGAAIIAAAGGDGTVHEVGNGILNANSACALAVIPLGTGNDFAKVVPGALPLATAYDTLARGNTIRYDAAQAVWPGGTEFFINGMGSGIDVEVVRQINSLPHMPGAAKYLLGLMRALITYRAVALRAELNGEVIERRVMMMALGNGVCQGGGFYLTPQASPKDGRLELCVIDALPLWRVPVILPSVLRGTHTAHAAVTMRSTQRVRFQSKQGTLYFQLDGELRETSSWVDVTIHPGALPVVTA